MKGRPLWHNFNVNKRLFKMKQITSFFLFLVCLFTLQAQTVSVTSNITTNTTWTNNNIYALSGGFLYVTDNATLTIEKGTIITGDAASLVITRGAKIVAEGTPEQPIVFTSYQTPGNRTAGDWGGLLILGKATINDPAGERVGEGGIDATLGLYGGTDDQDSSGVLRYVRIEYAGIAYIPNSETNGLTMGGVGSKTVIDHVQVSHGGDDSFEWFGGTVNTSHLVANGGLDDDFDTDYGFRGNNQFLVALRDSNIADVSKSNGMESDNDGAGSTNIPTTNATFSNLTSIGPKILASTVVNSNYGRALHLRRGTSQNVYNSAFIGWPTGLKIEGQATFDNVTNGGLEFKNNIIAGSDVALLDSSGGVFGMAAWFAAGSNTGLTNSSDAMLSDAFNYTNPNFLLMAGSPLSTGADFSASNLQSLETTTYRGAFDAKNDWTDCWTEWNAQNADYSVPTINYFSATPTITVDNTTGVLTAPAGYASYLWSNGATTQSITAAASGSFTVTVTNARGCQKTSAPANVSVGIEENLSFQALSMSPNPTDGMVNISFELAKNEEVTLSVLDLAGKVITSQQNALLTGKHTLNINMANESAGIYIVNIRTTSSQKSLRLTVTK